MLVVLKKPNDSVSFMFPSVINFIEGENTFRTNCKEGGFPKHLNRGEYYETWADKDYYGVRFVKYNQPISIYEKTTNEAECVLLGISYYCGTDYSRVTPLGDKVFVIHEKIRATNRDKISGDDVYGYHNEILNYIGLAHIDVENPKYEGEKFTKIKLTEKCQFIMYKIKAN